MTIRHIWFDFSDTIAAIDKEKHNALRYAEYARLKSRIVSEELIAEYNELFSRLGNSNSNVFVAEFGLPASFWPEFIDKHLDIYSLKEDMIPQVLADLSTRVPVSVFSNIDTREVMTTLGIDVSIFTHILSSSELTYPKPHTEGYEKIVEMSGVPASEVLYVGDDLKKDVLPAKSVGLHVGYMWGKCAEADYEFASFSDILKVI
jgi:FMN phosphatase YigB (HAD superfamily)